jgi:hypothetical protein
MLFYLRDKAEDCGNAALENKIALILAEFLNKNNSNLLNTLFKHEICFVLG